MVIPEATPTAKVMANSLNQKRAILSYICFPVRQYRNSITAIMVAKPILNGGNMKWKNAVKPNCSLDKNTASIL